VDWRGIDVQNRLNQPIAHSIRPKASVEQIETPAGQGNGMVSKVAVITGGASGIGAGCVEVFLANGWNVALNYYLDAEQPAVEKWEATARERGAEFLSVKGDVTSDVDCRRVARETVSRLGRIDALVCSAGYTRLVPHSDLDGLHMDDFARTTAVNTVGPFQMARACAASLAEDEGGAIVIVSSYGALHGTGSSIAYAASKGATNTLTMSLARVLAPRIRVNAVCPALVSGGFVERMDPEIFEYRKGLQINQAPLRKIARPLDVAKDIYWLCCEDSLITGSIISLDCGLHLNADANAP
jgi:3-oxoacyl-[acyl-carrier protein] reductase